MTYIELQIHDDAVYCQLLEDGSDKELADLEADLDDGRWLVNSSTHPEAVAINDFDATDSFIASALLIGMMRRLRMENDSK